MKGLSPQRSPAFQFSRMEKLLRGRPFRTVSVDGVDALFVNDPVLVRRILVKDSKSYGKGELFRKARNLSRVGLLTDDEAMHRHYRRLVNPYLRASKVEDYVPVMRAIARTTATSWHAGQTVDVQAQMCRTACAIALETVFRGLQPATSAALTEALTALSWEMMRKPLYGRAATRAAQQVSSARLARAKKDFRELLAACVAEQLRTPGATAGYRTALLTDLDDSGDRRLTQDQVVEETVMMLTAATVTTASVSSWALYILSREPSIEEKVLKDLTHRQDAPASGHGHPLSYTTRFLMEVLRLYPPVWITCRRTLTDVPLGDRLLPEGTNVVFSSYLLHRNPDKYPLPHRCDPDRWLTLRPGTDDASYIPFGIGAKGCIGEPMAWVELEIVLASVVQEWSLRLEPGSTVRTAAETTLHPRRLLMTAEPR